MRKMENASKALIMAAGVLIGILIISLGVFLFLDFASTSSTLHAQMRQEQIDQFNAQFTSYEAKDDNTIYDILTLVNLAKNNNNYYELDKKEENNYYITINMNNETNHSNLEKLSETKLNEFVKEDIRNQTEGKLPIYNCKVEISQNTGLVSIVKFTKK